MRTFILALAALMFAATLQPTVAASGSSTNAGKLAKGTSVSRRAGGRVVRRKKARVTSRQASRKRASKKRVSKKRVSRKRTAKKRASKRSAKRSARKRKAVASTKRSGRKAARRLRKGGKGRAMAAVDRGPVAPELIQAAYRAKEAGKLRAKAPWDCIPPELKAVMGQIAERWGTVTLNSSHRTLARNRAVGGKSRSFHLKCQAADFSVAGSHKGIVAFLRKHPLVGGYKRYRAGHFHIDTGPRRTW